MAADALTDGAITVDSFGWALLTALLASAFTTALSIVAGTNDDDEYTLRVTQRLARRSGEQIATDAPGIIFLEIDGLSKPVLQRAMRDGNAPQMARWLAEGTHRLVEWETDLSSQTGASQAGILLGSNENIPAFRWVEKENGTLMVCSNPDDCAEIERRHSTGDGLLANGGASRGNLLSGDADHVLLTVSRISAEKKANPGYRAFFANGFNVTRLLVLVFWEVFLELTAAVRQAKRDVRPRGHRGVKYAFIRAGVCVFVRDLTVHAVISDMFKGRPAMYATFASYDEVAHHSGLERRRHARGAAQARPAVRPHRPRPPLRAAAVRDRRPLRPRPDAGRDLQAAPRLRPRRPDPPLDRREGRGGRRRGRERSRSSATPSPRRPAPRRRRTRRSRRRT